MKNRIITSCVCLIGMILGSAMAGDPEWYFYKSGSFRSITAQPNSGSDITQIFVGRPYNYGSLAMIEVSAVATSKPNGLSANAIASGDAVYGTAQDGNGVFGLAYYGVGVRGQVPYHIQNAGIAGQFTNLNGKTALIVDKGNSIFIDNTNSNHNPVLNVAYNGTDAYDHIAISGTSQPYVGYGIGGKFVGNYYGVWGIATSSGSYYRFGGYFEASGSTEANHGIYAWAPSGTDDYAGYFAGKVYSTGGYYPSDEKLKKDSSPLIGALDKVMKLNPVNYFYKTDEYPKMSLPKEKQTGLIAQELETVFPEFVGEASSPGEKDTLNPDNQKKPEKFKTINYTALIPVLIKAIQEQQQTIEELKKKIY